MLPVQMSADVARGHGCDGGDDDHPPPYQVPTVCGGCLGNRVTMGSLGPTTFGESLGVVLATTLLGAYVTGAEGVEVVCKDWRWRTSATREYPSPDPHLLLTHTVGGCILEPRAYQSSLLDRHRSFLPISKASHSADNARLKKRCRSGSRNKCDMFMSGSGGLAGAGYDEPGVDDGTAARMRRMRTIVRGFW
ncbi:hypothetical protein Tco_0676311, partial [Tanacetum coccineum]